MVRREVEVEAEVEREWYNSVSGGCTLHRWYVDYMLGIDMFCVFCVC
jgi:hypothetical protein